MKQRRRFGGWIRRTYKRVKAKIVAGLKRTRSYMRRKYKKAQDESQVDGC